MNKTLIKVDTEISNLLHEIANTPLKERKTPEYWLGELRRRLLNNK